MKKIPSIIFFILCLPAIALGGLTGIVHYLLGEMWFFLKEAHKDVRKWLDAKIMKSFKS